MRLVSRTQNRASPITLLPRSLRRLGGRGRGSSRRSTAFLRSRKISGDLILADFKDDKFVRRHARPAAHVELYGLAGGLIFLLDGSVIHKHRHGVLRFFQVNLVQCDLNWPDLLRRLALGDFEFVIVSVAAALE